MLEPVLTRLAYLCDFIPGHLATIGEAEFAHRPAPDKWSKKEIIGHLLDSATNNHHRLVRAQFEDTPTITYDQIKWNSHGFYQQLATPQLIAFWAAYNRQLLALARHIPLANLQRCCYMGGVMPVSLADLLTDYVAHLEHHLRQVVTYA